MRDHYTGTEHNRSLGLGPGILIALLLHLCRRADLQTLQRQRGPVSAREGRVDGGGGGGVGTCLVALLGAAVLMQPVYGCRVPHSPHELLLQLLMVAVAIAVSAAAKQQQKQQELELVEEGREVPRPAFSSSASSVAAGSDVPAAPGMTWPQSPAGTPQRLPAASRDAPSSPAGVMNEAAAPQEGPHESSGLAPAGAAAHQGQELARVEDALADVEMGVVGVQGAGRDAAAGPRRAGAADVQDAAAAAAAAADDDDDAGPARPGLGPCDRRDCSSLSAGEGEGGEGGVWGGGGGGLGVCRQSAAHRAGMAQEAGRGGRLRAWMEVEGGSYFQVAVLGYGLGLACCVCSTASLDYRLAEASLMFLVPFTVLPILVLAHSRAELAHLLSPHPLDQLELQIPRSSTQPPQQPPPVQAQEPQAQEPGNDTAEAEAAAAARAPQGQWPQGPEQARQAVGLERNAPALEMLTAQQRSVVARGRERTGMDGRGGGAAGAAGGRGGGGVGGSSRLFARTQMSGLGLGADVGIGEAEVGEGVEGGEGEEGEVGEVLEGGVRGVDMATQRGESEGQGRRRLLGGDD